MHPLLRNFGDEMNAVLVRLLAYASGLAILALIAADVLVGSPETSLTHLRSIAVEATPQPSLWQAAARPHAAIALPIAELNAKTNTYDILRHPEGGRRDVISWFAAGDRKPLGQLELYRPGGELAEFGPASAEIAQRAGLTDPDQIQAAGVVITKFGPVALLGFRPGAPASGQDVGPDARQCLGFMVPFENPRSAILGWFCQTGTPPRTLAACALDRLTLVASGSDARMAEIFARAELKRGSCGSAGLQAMAQAQADWITSLDAPQLRGRLTRD